MEPTEPNVIMVFIKNPLLGKVKTRLAKTIGNLSALKVYRRLIKQTRELVEEMEGCDRMVFYNEFVPVDDEWKNVYFQKYQQPKADGLCEKMKFAFEKVFNMGYEKALLISPDCPKLSNNILNNAFRKLEDTDVVIGPCKDGNYYLIGMKKVHDNIFENKIWSDETAFEKTMNDINKANIKCHVLPELIDVDREEDLEHFKNL